MKIGIIGAGHVGGALTQRLTALGYDVAVANSRGPATLTDLAARTGATAASAEDAVRDAGLVIVAVPEQKVQALPSQIFGTRASGAPIVDTCNYYPKERDGRIDAIERGMPESRWAEQYIGQPVVKAFNSITAEHLLQMGRPRGTQGRVALPVAGDDTAAKQVVMRVVDELGFDAIDDGGIDDSWRQQPGTPCYLADLDADRLRGALAQASPEQTASWRA
jgi:8-hydroxy-5-deazaflavin:NADPH oxidoreductase